MLPHYLHEEAAVKAFSAGKHVVLEKPTAPTLGACDRIPAGAIGEVVTASAYFGGAAGPPNGPKPWRYVRAKADDG